MLLRKQSTSVMVFIAVTLGAPWVGAAPDNTAQAPATNYGIAHTTNTTERQNNKWPPQPEAIGERVDERANMVLTQMQKPPDSRLPITNASVLNAMRSVPRHVFVPEHLQAHAYSDTPLPIGHEQTISQPYMVAIMTELLELTPESKVLEIGTGSGYQAAVLNHLTPYVYTIEILKPLAEQTTALLRDLGYGTVQTRLGDGYFGWPEAAPFDAVIVTSAVADLPKPLWDQLKPGGRVVVPLGEAGKSQRLVVMHKTHDGERESETVMKVRFVPMTGEVFQE